MFYRFDSGSLLLSSSSFSRVFRASEKVRVPRERLQSGLVYSRPYILASGFTSVWPLLIGKFGFFFFGLVCDSLLLLIPRSI